jgi:hypothetical protein
MLKTLVLHKSFATAILMLKIEFSWFSDMNSLLFKTGCYFGWHGDLQNDVSGIDFLDVVAGLSRIKLYK